MIFIMNRLFLLFSGFFGATGIILGSLASHALTSILTDKQLEIFRLGVQYQMFHAVALLGIGAWLSIQKNRFITVAGWLFIIGIILFSGTMYGITYLGLPNAGTAPIGGFAFILGWLSLIVAAFNKARN